MRLTVSFSLKEETMQKLRDKLRADNSYRNKSHLVECAIEEYLKEALAVEQMQEEQKQIRNKCLSGVNQ